MKFTSLQITHNDSSEANLSHLRNKQLNAVKKIQTDSLTPSNHTDKKCQN